MTRIFCIISLIGSINFFSFSICFAQNNTTLEWAFFSYKKNISISKINQNLNFGGYTIPFIKGYTIPKIILDTLILNGRYNERQEIEKGHARFIPTPCGLDYKGRYLEYENCDTIDVKSSKYLAFHFYLSKTKDFFEHDCYSFYYSDSIGIFLVEDQVGFEEHIGTGYDYYSLSEKRDSMGNEIIRKKLLRSLTKTILKKEGWL